MLLSSLRRSLALLCFWMSGPVLIHAASEFTVISFGDSTTAVRKGVVNYTTQLERRFSSLPSPVRFLNRGVPGDNTDDACRRLKTDILDLQPNLVIIQFGINDAAVDVWKVPPAQLPRVALEKYEKNLRHIVIEIRRIGAGVILMTPNQLRWAPITREKYRLPPYDLSDERGFTRPLAPYADAVRTIAADLNVPLIDMYAAQDAWEKMHGKSCVELMVDGQHPNTEGHTLVADALAPIIAGALRGQKHSSEMKR